MGYYPTSCTPIKRVGLREICQVNGHHFRRLRGTEEWNEYYPDDEIEGNTLSKDAYHEPCYLSLILEEQNPGEPNHWSLFVAREDMAGFAYAVTGDAEYMTYQPSKDAIKLWLSPSFLASYQLAALTEQQAMLVKDIAEHETPPRAINRQSVNENCQGWTVRVIAKLVESGVVPSAKLQMARSMMQPV